MAARRLTDLGAASAVVPEALGQLSRQLKKALGDARLSKAAQAFATSHAGYDQATTIRQAADRCEAQLQKVAP